MSVWNKHFNLFVYDIQIKKGEHRCHIAVYDKNHRCKTYSISLQKGLRDRIQEEVLCSHLLLHVLAEAANTSTAKLPPLYLRTSSDNELVEVVHTGDHSETLSVFEKLYAGSISHAMFVPYCEGDDDRDAGSAAAPSKLVHVEDLEFPDNCIVYSGSFNPVHEGHIKLVLAALKTRGWTPDQASVRPNPPVIFELPPFNADKAAIEISEVEKRLLQFDTRRNKLFADYNLTNVAVCVTTKPLFVQKTEIFRNGIFVVGADTFVRIVEPKWYAPKTTDSSLTAEEREQVALNGMIAALAKMFTRGCSFIVGGRLVKATNQFETLSSIWSQSPVAKLLPAENFNMFAEIPEEEFRLDLSSTEIRNRESRA
jgi:hypothetical protein